MRIDLQCPAEVWNCRLPGRSEDPCEITLFNLGDKGIVSVEITLVFVDTEGRELQRVMERIHDLKGEPHSVFEALMAIPADALNPAPARVEISLDKLWYEDGVVWRRSRGSLVEYRTNALPRGRALARLRRVAGEDAIGYPEHQGSLWICVCGRPNPENGKACVRCGRDRDTVFSLCSREAVDAAWEQESAQTVVSQDTGRLGAGQENDVIERKHRNRWPALLAAALVLAVGGYFAAKLWLLPYLDYRQAAQHLARGEYEQAEEGFAGLNGWGDSEAQLQETRYRSAFALLDAENFDRAEAVWADLGGYRDSAAMITEAEYRRAVHLMGEGYIGQAQEVFRSLGDYRDSRDQVIACDYQKAEELYASGHWEEASAAFAALEGYRDSEAKSLLCLYRPGKQALDEQKPDEAIAWLSQLPADYKDAASLLQQAHYLKASNLLEGGDSAAAGAEFLLAGDYEDAPVKAQECIYAPAAEAMEAGDWERAAGLFAGIPGYRDADERYRRCIYEEASAAVKGSAYEKAQELLALLPEDYENAADLRRICVYEPALAAASEGRYGEAAVAFEALGDYRDSPEQARKARYGEADSLYAAGDYAGAYERFAALGDHVDSASRAREARYAQASALMNEERYGEAAAIFAELGKYKQSDVRLQEAQYMQAAALLAIGDYTDARALFVALGGYADSPRQVLDCDYARAEALAEAGNKGTAAESFAALGDYRDAAERANALWYELAETAIRDGNLMAGAALYSRLGDYLDSAQRLVQIQDDVYGVPAETAQAALDSGNAAAAAYLLDQMDLTSVPERYAFVKDLYLAACYTEGRRLMDAGEDERAYPYLQRCAGYRDTDALMNRTAWSILGTWRSESHTFILRKSGTMTIDGETFPYSLQGYEILLEDAVAFKIAGITGETMTLRDVRENEDNAVTLTRTARDELLPLPEAQPAQQTPATATDLATPGDLVDASSTDLP